MLTVLFQLTAERHLSLERKHKTLLFFQLFPLLREIILQLLVLDHDILFLCEFPHFAGDVERIPEVDGEHSEKHADEKGKCQMMRKPVDPADHIRIDKEIIHASQHAPYD